MGARAITRVALEFESRVTIDAAATELGVTISELSSALPSLDTRLAGLAANDGVERYSFTLLFTPSMCILHRDSEFPPASCP